MTQTYIHIHTMPPDCGEIHAGTASVQGLYAQADMLCTLHRLELSGIPVPGLRKEAEALAAQLRGLMATGHPAATAAWLTLMQDLTWPCDNAADRLADRLIDRCETYRPATPDGSFYPAEVLIRLCHYSPASTSILQTRLRRLFAQWAMPASSPSTVTALRRGWLLALWARTSPGDGAALHAARQLLQRHASAAVRCNSPAARIALHRLLCELDDAPHPSAAAPLRPLFSAPSVPLALRAAARAEILRADVLARIARAEQDIEAAETTFSLNTP